MFFVFFSLKILISFFCCVVIAVCCWRRIAWGQMLVTPSLLCSSFTIHYRICGSFRCPCCGGHVELMQLTDVGTVLLRACATANVCINSMSFGCGVAKKNTSKNLCSLVVQSWPSGKCFALSGLGDKKGNYISNSGEEKRNEMTVPTFVGCVTLWSS